MVPSWLFFLACPDRVIRLLSAASYFSVLVIPASVSIGLLFAGPSSYLTIVVVFGLVPLLDALIGLNTANPASDEEKALRTALSYQLLTWICAAAQVVLVIWGIAVFAGGPLTVPERLGLILSLGISSGGMGIVVSHELMHRIDNCFEPLLGRIALASVLYLRLTNYLLFNLQRHPDHHGKPGRRYQILRHFEESPQLPAG